MKQRFVLIAQDLPAVIRKTAKFLGKTLSEDEVSSLTKHLSFEEMKKNPAVNLENVLNRAQKIHGRAYDSTFIRKGKVGSWKDELPESLVEEFDRWIKENSIGDFHP
jgi:hypothetical protein